ncbi:MAG: hypothetical protein SF162_20400 [bacterium]|nr:hypothetical protein [bacterium]
MTTSQRAEQLAAALVAALKAADDLHDPRIEQALLRVPRHVFLPELPLEQAYANDAIPLKRDSAGNVTSSVSQPAMIVQMLEQLALEPGQNVLEIGTATGYNAALMQYLVGDAGRVTSVELELDLIERAQRSLQRVQMNGDVTVVQADGANGYAPRAAYDRIIATAGVWDVPPAWERQLKPKGILVTPIWLEAVQVSAAFRFDEDGTLISDHNLPCWFVRMRGGEAGPELTARVGNSSLELISTEIRRIDGAALQSLMEDWVEINYLDMPLQFWKLFGGFLPYLTLNTPPDATLAYFGVNDETAPFGIKGAGFALLMSGSACFISFTEGGGAHCFGSADAFLTAQDFLNQWRTGGEPGIEGLRMRLLPPGERFTPPRQGKLFPRRHHTLHAWYG